MKKFISAVALGLTLALTAPAQSVQEGVNHLYAERYTSARNTFEKLTAANPNNMEAAYWLGQTHLAAGDAAAAGAVYDKALSTNGAAPLMMVGKGHVNLVQGNADAARPQFEAAITASSGKKGPDPMVLNAIGRANVESTKGDPAYAIQKLTQASQLQPNNGDIYINLGNAYRKAKDGGAAVTNYSKALATMPALANWRQARIYQTQRNWDVVLEKLNAAIAADPKFLPAYEDLYEYQLMHKQNFAAAEELSKKMAPLADNAGEAKYREATTLYLQKRYPEAIALTKPLVDAGGSTVRPAWLRLLAYSSLETADTAAAVGYVDQLFSKTTAQDRKPADYTLKATAYAQKSPSEVLNVFMDAAQEDTTLAGKANLLNEALEWSQKNKYKIPEADIRLAIYNINQGLGKANPASLATIGSLYYQGRAFKRADSTFEAYSAAFPDSTYGLWFSARSRYAQDSAGLQGLAVTAYEKMLQVAAKSENKPFLKSRALEAAGVLATYYANYKNDREKGAYWLEQGLLFDPENAAFKNNIQKLRTPVRATPPPAPAKSTKPGAPKAAPKTTPAKKPAAKKS